MRSLVSYIMRGRMQAMLVTSVTAIVSLLPFLALVNYLSGAVVGLVTLRKGWYEGLLIILGAGAVVSIFAVLTSLHPELALVFAVVIWLPVWMLALILRRSVSLTLVVSAAAAAGALLIVMIYLIGGDPTVWWRGVFDTVLEQLQSQQGSREGAEMVGKALESVMKRMTGLLGAAVTLGLLCSLLLARWWQSLLYNPDGFRREFHALRLSQWFAAAVLLVLVVSLAGSGLAAEAASDAVIVAFAVYILHGLGLVHGFWAARNSHVGWKIGFYVLIGVLPQAIVLLVLIAYSDSWLDFRRKFVKTGA